MAELFANSGGPDQTPHNVASDQGLQGSSWLRNLGRSDFSLQTKQGEVL